MSLTRDIIVDLNQHGGVLDFRKRVHILAQILKWYRANTPYISNGK